jgi:hypothetical protein
MRLGVFLAVPGFFGVGRADERTVIVPRDDKPFTVAKSDIVRLTARGISGSRINVSGDGPAKVDATSNVHELINGHALIGNQTKEYDLQATGTGKVTVTITVTPPQPKATQRVTKYHFELR